jgi:hypothetical protein
MCKTHNALLAEQDYGEDLMARFRAGAGRASLPVDAYGARIVVRSRGLSPGYLSPRLSTCTPNRTV